MVRLMLRHSFRCVNWFLNICMISSHVAFQFGTVMPLVAHEQCQSFYEMWGAQVLEQTM
jgi:hypothetical protein